MQYRPLGQSGIQASVVAFGAWAIGGWMWGGADSADSVRAIHAAIDAGINLIDTAPAYGFGASESVLGEVLKDRRDEVVLATKCGLVTNTTRGVFKFNSDTRGIDPNGTIRVHQYLGPESIRAEVEGSLLRLKTDYIDLYQTHWQDSSTPIALTMECLLQLKREGKIRAIGVSNATPEQMAAYRSVGPLDTDQEKYSMLDQAHAAAQITYCRDNNVAILAYSPLAQGLVTGKIGPDRVFAPGDMRAERPQYSVENRRRVAAMLAKFQPIANDHGLTLAQLAIAWTVAQPGVTHALCGARTPAQAQENAVGGCVTLSPAELATMSAAIAAM